MIAKSSPLCWYKPSCYGILRLKACIFGYIANLLVQLSRVQDEHVVLLPAEPEYDESGYGNSVG